MMLPEAAEGYVRFSADWDGQTRHVFVADAIIEADVGLDQPLSHAEAIAYVLANINLYIEQAQRQVRVRPHGLGKIIILERESETPDRRLRAEDYDE